MPLHVGQQETTPSDTLWQQRLPTAIASRHQSQASLSTFGRLSRAQELEVCRQQHVPWHGALGSHSEVAAVGSLGVGCCRLFDSGESTAWVGCDLEGDSESVGEPRQTRSQCDRCLRHLAPARPRLVRRCTRRWNPPRMARARDGGYDPPPPRCQSTQVQGLGGKEHTEGGVARHIDHDGDLIGIRLQLQSDAHGTG
jgi:hypothetical protein